MGWVGSRHVVAYELTHVLQTPFGAYFEERSYRPWPLIVCTSHHKTGFAGALDYSRTCPVFCNEKRWGCTASYLRTRNV